MEQRSRYQELVAEAKKEISEIAPGDAAEKVRNGEAVLIDVRDKEEFDGAHIPQAMHLSRGLLEVEIEDKVADPNAVVILHCGGGGRSALAAQSLQKMGYKNVYSMAGGFKGWKAAGLPVAQ